MCAGALLTERLDYLHILLAILNLLEFRYNWYFKFCLGKRQASFHAYTPFLLLLCLSLWRKAAYNGGRHTFIRYFANISYLFRSEKVESCLFNNKWTFQLQRMNRKDFIKYDIKDIKGIEFGKLPIFTPSFERFEFIRYSMLFSDSTKR